MNEGHRNFNRNFLRDYYVYSIYIIISVQSADSGDEAVDLNMPALSLPSYMSGYAVKQGAVVCPVLFLYNLKIILKNRGAFLSFS